MAYKNEPHPKYWPEKRKDSDEWWDQAVGHTILSDDMRVYEGGPGRQKRTSKWEEKDCEDAEGN